MNNFELILFLLALILAFGIGYGLGNSKSVTKYERRISDIQHNVEVYVAAKTRERQ
jgi:hypothetical protein